MLWHFISSFQKATNFLKLKKNGTNKNIRYNLDGKQNHGKTLVVSQ